MSAASVGGTAPLIRFSNVRKVYRTGGSDFVAVSDATLDEMRKRE